FQGDRTARAGFGGGQAVCQARVGVAGCQAEAGDGKKKGVAQACATGTRHDVEIKGRVVPGTLASAARAHVSWCVSAWTAPPARLTGWRPGTAWAGTAAPSRLPASGRLAPARRGIAPGRGPV